MLGPESSPPVKASRGNQGEEVNVGEGILLDEVEVDVVCVMNEGSSSHSLSSS